MRRLAKALTSEATKVLLDDRLVHRGPTPDTLTVVMGDTRQDRSENMEKIKQ